MATIVGKSRIINPRVKILATISALLENTYERSD